MIQREKGKSDKSVVWMEEFPFMEAATVQVKHKILIRVSYLMARASGLIIAPR